VLGHHRAVQAEEHGVERQRGAQVLDEHGRDPLEGVLGDVARGRRRGPGQRKERRDRWA
jgi:hypothetical protein